jgi:hypothetical protein
MPSDYREAGYLCGRILLVSSSTYWCCYTSRFYSPQFYRDEYNGIFPLSFNSQQLFIPHIPRSGRTQTRWLLKWLSKVFKGLIGRLPGRRYGRTQPYPRKMTQLFRNYLLYLSFLLALIRVSFHYRYSDREEVLFLFYHNTIH